MTATLPSVPFRHDTSTATLPLFTMIRGSENSFQIPRCAPSWKTLGNGEKIDGYFFFSRGRQKPTLYHFAAIGAGTDGLIWHFPLITFLLRLFSPTSLRLLPSPLLSQRTAVRGAFQDEPWGGRTGNKMPQGLSGALVMAMVDRGRGRTGRQRFPSCCLTTSLGSFGSTEMPPVCVSTPPCTAKRD